MDLARKPGPVNSNSGRRRTAGGRRSERQSDVRRRSQRQRAESIGGPDRCGVGAVIMRAAIRAEVEWSASCRSRDSACRSVRSRLLLLRCDESYLREGQQAVVDTRVSVEETCSVMAPHSETTATAAWLDHEPIRLARAMARDATDGPDGGCGRSTSTESGEAAARDARAVAGVFRATLIVPR